MSDERIGRFKDGDLHCLCGGRDNFYPCRTDGQIVEPVPGEWDGIHYGCGDCDRVFNHDTLEVTGERWTCSGCGWGPMECECTDEDSDEICAECAKHERQMAEQESQIPEALATLRTALNADDILDRPWVCSCGREPDRCVCGFPCQECMTHEAAA